MKTYEDAMAWMYGQLPVYQRQGKKALRKGLQGVSAFLHKLKNPHLAYPVIHVGGTNGKGSVASMIASVLKEAGYKVGLYTSPHLKDFRERIRVNGKPIQRKVVTGFVRHYRDYFLENNLSLFEISVVMAFEYFKKMKVDVAVVEVGLGGQFDSTNVVQPVLSVITRIRKDHTEILGDSLEQIAKEKAGIIKEGVPVVLGQDNMEVLETIRSIAREKRAPFILATAQEFPCECDLSGPYQKNNIDLTVSVINYLRTQGWHITESALVNGLSRVKKNTGLRGRWEVIKEYPLILVDTGHNPDAFEFIVKGLEQLRADKRFFVLGFVQGKDVGEIVRLLPRDAAYFLATPDVPRGMPVEETAKYFEEAGLSYRTFPSVSAALEAAKNEAGIADLIFVGGSTFTVAEII